MKKFAVIMVSILLGLFVLAGCDMGMLAPGDSTGGTDEPGGTQPTEKTELEVIAEKYGKVAEAASIVQTVDITAESGLVQYQSQKTYKKAGTGYQIVGTEKRLNPITSGAATAYTETPIEMTVKAGTFTPQLELNELYFTNTAIANGTLEATILDSSVETVLGLGEDLPSPVHGMTLKIVTDTAHVTSMDISYASGASHIAITLRFSY